MENQEFFFQFYQYLYCREVNILICFILTLSRYENIFIFYSFSQQKIFVSVFLQIFNLLIFLIEEGDQDTQNYTKHFRRGLSISFLSTVRLSIVLYIIVSVLFQVKLRLNMEGRLSHTCLVQSSYSAAILTGLGKHLL